MLKNGVIVFKELVTNPSKNVNFGRNLTILVLFKKLSINVYKWCNSIKVVSKTGHQDQKQS